MMFRRTRHARSNSMAYGPQSAPITISGAERDSQQLAPVSTGSQVDPDPQQMPDVEPSRSEGPGSAEAALAEARRSLAALRLSVPAQVADDVSRIMEAAFSAVAASPTLASGEDPLAPVKALLQQWEGVAGSALMRSDYQRGQQAATYACIDGLRQAVRV